MGKYAVVYWSGTGNTEAMAEEIAEGIRAAGKQAELFTAAEFSDGQVAEYDGIAFGCPSMGAEELESEEFAPMFEAVLPLLKEKKVALFGSYGWGDGEWMRNWEERVASAGANLVNGEGVMANEEPDDEAKENCKKLGRDAAAL